MTTMKPETKKAAKIRERDEARTKLREIFPAGSTAPTVLRHCSRSGEMLHISVLSPDCDDVSYLVARALDMKRADDGGLKVGGGGMDMGFHVVYNLSYVLYGAGYACLGKGCPSSYHNNHRDTIRCEGHNGHFCYRPGGFFGPREDVPANWPRLPDLTVKDDAGEPIAIGQGPAYGFDVDGVPTVCPTCQGHGHLPNPEGPERFDLTHTDGYALRHRWV